MITYSGWSKHSDFSLSLFSLHAYRGVFIADISLTFRCINTIAGSSTDPVLLNLCKTIDERSQFNSEDNTSFGRSQLLKEDLVNAMVDPSNISESFDSCPYYLR